MKKRIRSGKLFSRSGILILIAIAGSLGIFMLDPVPQDPAYHFFADDRCMADVPNFWNVISNLPFLLIGLPGMIRLLRKKKFFQQSQLGYNYFVFFVGIFLTGIGSAYYHLHPTNETLVWDRLPMTIAFMSIFTIIIGEYISLNAGKRLLIPFMLIGLMSIVYWQLTEARGEGDLRFYILVQFLPILLIPFTLLFFKKDRKTTGMYWLILGTYVVAKLFESTDHSIFEVTGGISGHTLKHLMAAAGPALLLVRLYRQSRLAFFHK